jgi:hypothetical protein
MSDMINHPDHYKHGSMETIDIIKAMTGEGFESYLVGNITKYLSRYKYKNGVEDLRKAATYLGFLIAEQPEVKEPIKIIDKVKPLIAETWSDVLYLDPSTGKYRKLGIS